MFDQWQRLVAVFILPPGGIIVLLVICLLLVRNMKFTLFIATAALYFISTPYASHLLFSPLETYPALSPQEIVDKGASAILVLGAAQWTEQKEYNSDIVSPMTMTRLRYAAYLHRKTGLPIITSGGKFGQETIALGDLAVTSLQEELGIKGTIYAETSSQTTAENLLNVRSIIQQNGFNKIALVTHAWHMPRAVQSALQAGVRVIPAPTAFYAGELKGSYTEWLPLAQALSGNYFALHEILGKWWYKIRKEFDL